MGRSSDFKFWEENLPVRHRSCGDEGELFQVQRQVEDQVGACSPPMWRRARVEFRPESSSLLPQKHQYSCLSPTSRIRAIIDGQRELMEMIKDMPESSYELSLKDMVDQQNKEDVVLAQEKEVAVAEEEEIVKHKRENRIPRRNTKICRSESMESEVFLLKLFVPASLGSKKKKAKTRKHLRKCPGQASEGPEKEANKEWWKIIFLAIRDTHKNTSNISNRTSEKKHKSRGRRGCLF